MDGDDGYGDVVIVTAMVLDKDGGWLESCDDKINDNLISMIMVLVTMVNL